MKDTFAKGSVDILIPQRYAFAKAPAISDKICLKICTWEKPRTAKWVLQVCQSIIFSVFLSKYIKLLFLYYHPPTLPTKINIYKLTNGPNDASSINWTCSCCRHLQHHSLLCISVVYNLFTP
jgi:hypothetical protein